MENPEEVLQALDEFQKLRPTEIPRELEEYLCWVAKTGDPVYQWSLIKALFREKLARVMTDFYESCPSLDLTPCPNVEHFNYDTMKNNLLERLESFANAPFTVQRICELLTAPRKEYNRVDKFMRAIEKNILVVSTREPGLAARRSENGDGLVNGSIEDDDAQPAAYDVEMESWVKDCSPATTITVRTAESDPSLLETVMPVTTTVKSLPTATDNDEDDEEDTPAPLDKSERARIASLPASQQAETTTDTGITVGVQNLSTMAHEAPGIVGDVPEAIMNEDTSSQPSLELEGDEAKPSIDPVKKLQTTFQARDFVTCDSKLPKFYVDELKNSAEADADGAGNTQERSGVVEEQTTETNAESKLSVVNGERVERIADDISPEGDDLKHAIRAEQAPGIDQASLEGDASREENSNFVSLSIPSDEELTRSESAISEPESSATRSNGLEESVDGASASISSVDERASTANMSAMAEDSNSADRDSFAMDERSKNSADDAEAAVENSKPVVEEPPSEEKNAESIRKSKNCNFERDGLTIEETVEDDVKTRSSIIPDPIPIVEEPKDADARITRVERLSVAEELTDDTKDDATAICHAEPLAVAEKTKATTEVFDSTTFQEGRSVTTAPSPPATRVSIEEETPLTESMEVDSEEPALAFQQDEPMDQEMAEPTKS